MATDLDEALPLRCIPAPSNEIWTEIDALGMATGPVGRAVQGSESHNNAGCELEVVLRIVCGIGKLGAQVVDFEGAKFEMPRQIHIQSAACFHGKAAGRGCCTGGVGEDAVEPEGFAQQSLAIEAVARMRGRPCVAWTEGGRNQVEFDTGRVDLADVRAGNVGHHTPATIEPPMDLRAGALHPEL